MARSAGAETPSDRSATWLAEAGLALTVVAWGVNLAVVKRTLAVMTPLGFNGLRFLLASGFFLVVLRARGPLRLPAREDLPRIALLGLVGNTAYQLAFILGLDRTRAGNASLMLALVPIFVLFFERRGGEGGARVWLGSAISVVGVALVSGATLRMEGVETLVGDLLMLGAAAVWALYTTAARPLIARYGAVQATAWMLWVGAVGILLASVPELLRQPWDRVGPWAWGGLLYSAFFSVGLAYLLWSHGVKRLGSSRTAIYSNLVPVVALAAGALWLGERLTPLALLGASLVLAGLMLVRRRDRGGAGRARNGHCADEPRSAILLPEP